MSEHYYPPLFLTGELPKRNSEEIIWLILCLKTMGIKIPKDLLQTIYWEFLDVVEWKRGESYYTSNQNSIRREYDFAVIEVQSGATIYFNSVGYALMEGRKYLLCPNLLPWISIVVINGGKYSVSYYSFADEKSAIRVSFNAISSSLNSNIDNEGLLYLSQNNFRRINRELTVHQKENNPNLQEHIDICLKYGVISLTDPLPFRDASCLIDETGAIRDWSFKDF